MYKFVQIDQMPLIDLYEISHMHPIRPYDNDSLCVIDSDQKREGV